MQASLRFLSIAVSFGVFLSTEVGAESPLEKSIADKVGAISKRITEEVDHAKAQTQKVVESIERNAVAISPECSEITDKQSGLSTDGPVSNTNTTDCKSQALSSGETSK